MKKYNIAIVGATGAVGVEMLKMLIDRNFPIGALRLFASERSAGKQINGITVEALKPDGGKGMDIALFSAGGDISREFAPLFAKDGCTVIDNSSAWRMDPSIPLIVPEVNPNAMTPSHKIIANPNCSTIQMVVA